MTTEYTEPGSNGSTMEKETLHEVRGLRTEVSEISRSQADLKTDQAAMLRDIHHMNLQMVDQAKSIKEMANAVVKLAAVSEKMDRANSDINELGEMYRKMNKDIAAAKEQSAKDKEELNGKIHVVETAQTENSGKIQNHEEAIKSSRWLIGSLLVLIIGGVIRIILGT